MPLELSSLLIFAGALLIAAGSPGPSVAALVARVLTRGYREVLPFLAAMWLGEAAWLSLAVFGLSAVAQKMQFLFTGIKYAGVAYLLFLAVKMWIAPAEFEESNLPRSSSAWKMFLTGMAITLGNPKIMLFYLALLPTIIDLGKIRLGGWAELTVVTILILMLVDLAWVAVASQTRRLLRSPRAMRWANRTSATMMGGAAIVIAER